MTEDARKLRNLLRGAYRVVFFGGAGVSTESGIPDFRSSHGLYSGTKGRSYETMLSHEFYCQHPEEFYDMYRNVLLYPNAQPNEAHRALARLEAQGRLLSVVTQNIDGLHQRAGSQKVWELHGSAERNLCTGCGRNFSLQEFLSLDMVPLCPDCGNLIKPDVVLYGENLDDRVIQGSVSDIRKCDLLIVGGTSLTVYPAAGLISYRKTLVPLVLINRDATSYDHDADLIIRDSIGKVLDEAIE